MSGPMITTPATPATAAAAATPPRPRGRFYRLAIPAAALAVFAAFALLWAAGLQPVGNAALRLVGVEPGSIPFLDTEAILAAAQCQRHGLDVYLADPCDVLGRPHVYSPLWLAAVPPGLGAAAAPWVGAALDLVFIAALALLIRPRSRGELLIWAVAVFSPMTLYAVERANNDLVIFLFVVGAGLLQARSRGWRLASYALLTGAALLKYYPAVLLSLAARERRRDALLVAGGAAVAAALFAARYHAVIGGALANIPRASYYADSFSAENLPFGLATGLPLVAAPTAVAIGLFATMAALATVWLRRATALLDGAELDWASADARFGAIGGLLLTGCFFAGQNINYRGVFFLFALAGLLRLRAAGARQQAARRFLSKLIGASLFLMWNECFRRALLALLAAQPDNRAVVVFWVVRELLWWWVIAGLGAVALCCLQRLPLAGEGAAWLARLGRGLRGACLAARGSLHPLARRD
jgi:hypothetical protein